MCACSMVRMDRSFLVMFDWQRPVAPLAFGKGAPRMVEEPYVCIAVQASGVQKCWLRPGGWDEIVRRLHAEGCRVLCIDGEPSRDEGGLRVARGEGSVDFTG